MNEIKSFFKGVLEFFKPSVLVSIIVFLLCIIGILYIYQSWPTNFYATKIIAPILISIVAAIVVSLTIDIKSYVSSVQDIIIDAFTSNSFLEKLPDDRLQEIRSNAITQMHKQKYPNMQEGLMGLDKEIFTALMHPYYETYREIAIYYKDKKISWDPSKNHMEQVLFRTDNIQYTIKSPTPDSVDTEADLSIRKCIQKPIKDNDLNVINQIFKINHFYVSIDDADRIDIQDDYYNTSLKLVCQNSLDNRIRRKSKYDNSSDGIFVEYKKMVKVEIDYEIYLPMEDNHFTNRLKYPTKSFRIDCFCNDSDDTRFYGQLLGTFTDNSKIKISSKG